ncbi:MAG: MBL fold metallo-hydrolase [Acidobacteriota bacterium]
MKIGNIEVRSLTAGSLYLDGGAMFGVVPRTLWEKKLAPDDRNRIPLNMNVLLVKAGGKNILLDTGAGDKEDEKFADMYRLSRNHLEESLAEADLKPGDIDIVVNTHLHFDHAGGNTVRSGNGTIAPAFPNAKYLVQRIEYDAAVHPHVRNKASYFDYNYKPLFDEGRMELLSGEREIAPGVAVVPLPGHTKGLQGLMIESGGEKGLYLTDCVPTSHHVALPWIMGYDLYPMETLETKKRILPKLARENWIVFFEHDPVVKAARLDESKTMKFHVEPLET